MNGWGYAMMGITSLLLWWALIFGVIALMRHVRGPAKLNLLAPTDPERVLAGQYAQGEIDDEEE